MNIINDFITLIFATVTYIISIVLTPINSLINNYLPSLSTFLNDDFPDFVDSLLGFCNWVLSYSGLSSTQLSIIKACWVAILTFPLLIHAVKLAVKWFNALKVG